MFDCNTRLQCIPIYCLDYHICVYNFFIHSILYSHFLFYLFICSLWFCSVELKINIFHIEVSFAFRYISHYHYQMHTKLQWQTGTEKKQRMHFITFGQQVIRMRCTSQSERESFNWHTVHPSAIVRTCFQKNKKKRLPMLGH